MKSNEIIMLGIYVLVNLMVLVPAIKSVLRNERLVGLRILWWCIIGLFNLTGALAYYLIKRDELNLVTSREDDSNTDRKHIFIGLMIIYEVISFPLIMNNRGSTVILVSTIAILLLAFINHHRYVSTDTLGILMAIFQIAGIISVNLLAVTDEFKVIILVVIINVMNEYPLQFIKRIAGAAFLLHMGANAAVFFFMDGLHPLEIALYILRNSITYALVVGAFYIGKKHIRLNHELQRLNLELREVNRELEESSIMRERTRIARDIHDTLGHTMTGAIIQLEAAKKLIHVDADKSLEAINKSQQITRDGLDEVKKAIKTLRPVNIEDGVLVDALEALFPQSEKNFGIQIKREIQIGDIRDDALKVTLYRIIQEAITNSVRHGDATELTVIIKDKRNDIELVIVDNGKGCSSVHEGYGLRGIRERVQSFDGQVKIRTRLNEGFQVLITIPM